MKTIIFATLVAAVALTACDRKETVVTPPPTNTVVVPGPTPPPEVIVVPSPPAPVPADPASAASR